MEKQNLEIIDLEESAVIESLSQESDQQIVLLPSNFENVSEHPPIFTSSLPTVLKLAKKTNLALGVYQSLKSPTLLEQRSIDWFAPTMFISSLYLSQNPDAVSIAVNMLSNYLTTLFSGRSDAKVRLEIYYRDQESKRTKKIKYEGPVAGLDQVSKAIKAIGDKSGKSN